MVKDMRDHVTEGKGGKRREEEREIEPQIGIKGNNQQLQYEHHSITPVEYTVYCSPQ